MIEGLERVPPTCQCINKTNNSERNDDHQLYADITISYKLFPALVRLLTSLYSTLFHVGHFVLFLARVCVCVYFFVYNTDKFWRTTGQRISSSPKKKKKLSISHITNRLPACFFVNGLPALPILAAGNFSAFRR